LAESREQAQRLILAGKVWCGASNRIKAGVRVDHECELRVEQGERYVSRGGLKLQAALDVFQINATGRACADIGASTGGFTDCLLQYGALRVYAVDVGKSQMHSRIKTDARVTLVENTNARELHADSLPEQVSLLAMDVSFISLTKILPALRAILTPGADAVVLVKPQFEAQRAEVSRGKGVIKDPAVHRKILLGVLEFVLADGWSVLGIIPSPITGTSGNREYLLHLRQNETAGGLAVSAAIDVDAAVESAFKSSMNGATAL
jgi:23S rRNA (cytidine1920-2'-O)/16S rRNA (cytidine1409-2'-O)-methyltransferase